MSAFTVGSQATATDDDGEVVPQPSGSAPAAFVKWIPGEAIAFYAALIGVGTAQGALTGNETADELLERIDAGSRGWFLTGAVLAALLVIAGAAAGKVAQTSLSPASIIIRVILTLGSFVIWATALPGSWPYSWHWIRDMGPAYALLLVPGAILFTAIAEIATRKFNL